MPTTLANAAVRASMLVLAGGILQAQLLTGDIILMTHSGFTHLRGGVSTPVTPAGATLPANWGDGSIEWVPATNFCVVASGLAPFDVYVLDFTSSITSPAAQIIGQGIGGGRGMDVVEGGTGMLLLQNTPAGGRISVIDAPVTPASVINPVPWADNLVTGSSDWMVSIDVITAVYGGVANAYFIPQGGTGGSGAAFAAGNLLYSARDGDRDSSTGSLYFCVENPNLVVQISPIGGPAVTILGPGDVTRPQDCAVDSSNGLLYVVAIGGVSFLGLPWGVQAGNDNAIIGVNLALGVPGGIFSVGPLSGHGNTGFFPNIAVVGNGAPSLAAVNYSGIGCQGSNRQPFTLGSTGLPVTGTTFTITAANGRPNSLAWIYAALALAPAPIPITGSCNLYVDPLSLSALLVAGVNPLMTFTLNGLGAAFLPTPIPNQPSLIGQQLALQALAIDAVISNGFVVSQGMQIIFG